MVQERSERGRLSSLAWMGVGWENLGKWHCKGRGQSDALGEVTSEVELITIEGREKERQSQTDRGNG